MEKLPYGECILGYVRANTLTTIYEDEPITSVGGLSVTAMKHVEKALCGALDLWEISIFGLLHRATP